MTAISTNLGYPFEAQLKCGFGKNDYDRAVCTVWEELNWNSGKTLAQWTWDDVERVLSAYYDVQVEYLSLPELNFEAKTPSAINENLRLVNTVAARCGINADDVKKVLEQLYWATIQGRISSQRVLFPRRFQKQGDVRKEGLGQTTTDYMKIGITAVFVIGGCVGLYYLARTYNVFTSQSS